MEETLVLQDKKVQQIIKRIAYQLYEDFIREDDLIMLGIEKKGQLFAHLLAKELNKLSEKNNKVLQGCIVMDKEEPSVSNTSVSLSPKQLKESTIILVDDVLNSGKTLMYAAAYIMQFNVRLMRTVVLVDRKHRRFPIKADYVGLTLSTTLKEHIQVEFKGKEVEAFLV